MIEGRFFSYEYCYPTLNHKALFIHSKESPPCPYKTSLPNGYFDFLHPNNPYRTLLFTDKI